jgi:hypothetical protein
VQYQQQSGRSLPQLCPLGSEQYSALRDHLPAGVGISGEDAELPWAAAANDLLKHDSDVQLLLARLAQSSIFLGGSSCGTLLIGKELLPWLQPSEAAPCTASDLQLRGWISHFAADVWKQKMRRSARKDLQDTITGYLSSRANVCKWESQLTSKVEAALAKARQEYSGQRWQGGGGASGGAATHGAAASGGVAVAGSTAAPTIPVGSAGAGSGAAPAGSTAAPMIPVGSAAAGGGAEPAGNAAVAGNAAAPMIPVGSAAAGGGAAPAGNAATPWLLEGSVAGGSAVAPFLPVGSVAPGCLPLPLVLQPGTLAGGAQQLQFGVGADGFGSSAGQLAGAQPLLPEAQQALHDLVAWMARPT